MGQGKLLFRRSIGLSPGLAQASFVPSLDFRCLGTSVTLAPVRGTLRNTLHQVKVEPDGAVVFRLKDAQGNIRVKIGAGENGSGLVLLDGDTKGFTLSLKKEGQA